MPSFRDFLVGRQDAIQVYRGQLDRAKNEAHEKAICHVIIENYHKQCDYFKKRIVRFGIEENPHGSLEVFVDAVIEFTNLLEGRKMTPIEAQIIMDASRFLQRCSAGRQVYTERCEGRDEAHIYNENQYSKALIALNNLRKKAVKALALERGKKEGGGKRGKGGKGRKKGKSGKGGKKGGEGDKGVENNADTTSHNLFGPLSDAEEEEETIEGLEGAMHSQVSSIVVPPESNTADGTESKAADGTDDTESKAADDTDDDGKMKIRSPEDFVRVFLDQGNLDEYLEFIQKGVQDDVQYILQSDHEFDISKYLWRKKPLTRRKYKSPPLKNFVHLPLYNNAPLPVYQVYDVLNVMPNNRVLFGIFGKFLRVGPKLTEDGEYQKFFAMFAEFVTKLKPDELSLVILMESSFWPPVGPAKEPPKQDVLRERLSMIKIIYNESPLCLAYLASYQVHMGEFVRNFTKSDMSGIARINACKHLARDFDTSTPEERPRVEDVILENVPFYKPALVDVRSPGSSSLTYQPVFVLFTDTRSVHPMDLPVEILEDNKSTVSLKIHSNEVFSYVRGILASRQDLQVYIRDRHPMTFCEDKEDPKNLTWNIYTKYVSSLVHPDGTTQYFSVSV